MKVGWTAWLLAGLVFLTAAFGADSASTQGAEAEAVVIQVEGAIGPATSAYVGGGDRGCARAGRAAPGAAHGHPRRARHLHALHHQGHHRLARAGGGLRGAERCPGGQRRHLHPLRQPRRRHGAGHQPGCGHSGADRRSAGGERPEERPAETSEDEETERAGDRDRRTR